MRVTNVKRNRTRLHRNEVAWDRAISEAESKLEFARRRAKRLREIVADLKQMKKSGQMWPGVESVGQEAQQDGA
ncbi:hypothetical protein SBA1_100081 [Candidatus Sulfotelmatobacter kueseliae]|uniref:Uncharacterized protein n=1 Tax=Candidatus Sulfotelmatobacter kueseliae TaxID=2042962 RepID=A0A2U3JW29_9BACT|nr:hypothetical protein SBA1_100081 [Candidatus Sulfotelmatobacter kueseliae]